MVRGRKRSYEFSSKLAYTHCIAYIVAPRAVPAPREFLALDQAWVCVKVQAPWAEPAALRQTSRVAQQLPAVLPGIAK